MGTKPSKDTKYWFIKIGKEQIIGVAVKYGGQGILVKILVLVTRALAIREASRACAA